jgi:hypothetical protein
MNKHLPLLAPALAFFASFYELIVVGQSIKLDGAAEGLIFLSALFFANYFVISLVIKRIMRKEN